MNGESGKDTGSQRGLSTDSETVNVKQIDLDELTYIISHDLQEPLRMITSYVQLLNKRYSDKLDENAKEYISFAVDGSNRLKKMMDDLLTYSRIGRLNFKREDLLMQEIFERVKKQIAEKHPGMENCLTLKQGSTEGLNADKQLLIKLLYSLTDNSIKFNSNSNPKVEINVTELNDKWELKISDNGIGIEKEYHGKIFGIFQKLHRHTDYPGSGIGLAVCEKIASIHNGDIRIDSELNKGSRFLVTIKKEIRE
ncbi:MAG: hypothetical protein IT280_03370 [Ignavibacteria bacterium]|nr:hypothetical protein [Ignavibacteria bacterium]